MFEEVKEMIDSTIYTNGRGEVTAKNLNLGMHAIVDATEEELAEVKGDVTALGKRVDEIAENGTGGGAGALRVWINEMSGGENNSEQVAENAETFKAMWNETPQMAILCAATGLGGFPMMMASPVVVYRLISENGEDMISMAYRDIIDQGNGLEIMETYVYLKQDGTVTIEY